MNHAKAIEKDYQMEDEPTDENSNNFSQISQK